MTGSLASRRGVAAASLIGLAVAAASPARAADDGYDNVFSSVLGSIGLIKGDAPPDIQYRERPPLVLPRTAELPKPVTGSSRHSAAWPQDPDVLRRRKESEEARAPHTRDPMLSDKGGLLSPDEMAKGRGGDAGAPSGGPVRPNECGNDGQHCLLVNPDVLKAEGERYRASNPEKSDTLVAGQEPDRVFLTQPPKGYMKPLKTVKATAEAPEEKLDPSNPRYVAQETARRKADQQ